MKHLITNVILILLFGNFLWAQQDAELYHSIAESKVNTLGKKYFVIGEWHSQQSETVMVHKEVMDILSKKGLKKIVIDVEATPAKAFYLQRYMETGDNRHLKDAGLWIYMERYFELFRSYQGQIEFSIVPLDLLCGADALIGMEFYRYLFHTDQLLEIKHETTQLNTKKKVAEFAKSYKQNYGDLTPIMSDKKYSDFFEEEMKIIAQFGYQDEKYCGQAEGIGARDARMAGVLDSTYNKEDSTPHIVICGRWHITPNQFQLPETLISRLKKVPREEVLVLPVYYAIDVKKRGQKSYENPSLEQWQEYVKQGKVDVLVNPIPAVKD